MGRAGRDGPVRLPGIDRVLRPGILWPGSARPAPPRSSARPAVRAWLPWIRKTPRGTPASRAARCRNAAPPVARCRAGSPAGAVPVQLAGARHPPCRAGACRGSLSLQRPGAIAAAVARASCRLTPVTRTRRIPALTGAGMFAAYAASILPGRRRALSPLAFRLVPGYGPRRARFPGERQAMSGGTPFIQGPGEFPCSENH